LLEQESVRAAIGELAARAETAARAAGGAKGESLTAMYVDPALTQQLASPNHQLLYGRRGAGKTHALRVMEKRLMGRSSEVVLYADLRELGDAREQQPQERAATYIRQLLAIIVREFATRSDEGYAFRQAQPQLEAFRRILDEQGFAVKDITSGISTGEASQSGASAGAHLTPAGPGLSAGLRSGQQSHSSETETTRMIPVEHVDFTAIAGALRDLTRAARLRRLTLLLDEWSEVKPLEVQTYLAEYIKRVFFPVEGVSVKVGAIQHRSRVGVRFEDGTLRGFEEAADIFPLTMLDETAFSFDRDPPLVESMFAELLYRHLTVALAERATEGRGPREPAAARPGGAWAWAWVSGLFRGKNANRNGEDIISRVATELRQPDWGETFFDATADVFMSTEFGVSGANDLVANMFESGAFRELARGAQGVPRDFISILKDAVFAPDIPSKLTQQSVRTAVRNFHTAKLGNLSETERRMFNALIQSTTRQDARCFLADLDLTADDTFQALLDQRLLHRIQPRVADPREPARTYDAYTLDYGAYVVLVGEGKLSDSDLTDRLAAEEQDTVAPFGDGRRFRRLIVSLADLNESAEPVVDPAPER